MEVSPRYRALDLACSAGAGLVLLAFGLWGAFEAANARRMVDMLAEMSAAELPTASRWLFEVAGTGLLEGLFIGLLLLGMAALFVIRDRLRANVTAILVALGLGGVAVLVRMISFLPLLKVIEAVGQ